MRTWRTLLAAILALAFVGTAFAVADSGEEEEEEKKESKEESKSGKGRDRARDVREHAIKVKHETRDNRSDDGNETEEDDDCVVTVSRWRETREENGTVTEERFREKTKDCEDDTKDRHEIRSKLHVRSAGWSYARCVVAADNASDCASLRPALLRAESAEHRNATSARADRDLDDDNATKASKFKARSARAEEVRLEVVEKRSGAEASETKIKMKGPADAIRELLRSWFGRG